MEKTFAFIGAGNMGGAIIEAVCRGAGAKNVLIYDRNEKKAAALAEKTGCRTADEHEAVRNAHFVFLCVKPNVLPAALKEICPELKSGGKVIVSIAAGVPKSAIKSVMEAEGVALPVVRLMPNTPVAVGKGMILVSPDGDVPEQDVQALLDALAPGGLTSLIAESYIDAATPVFSCSPAYVYMFIEALADGGVMAGLPRDKAQQFAAQGVLGSAAMVLESGKHPGQLKDEVCSPGGSTIVGVEELEKSAFRGAVASAVYEAYKKTASLGK